MQPAAPPLDVTPAELEALLEGVREALGEDGYQKLKAAIRTLSYVTELLENRETTLETLRRLLCQSSTEKTEQVLKQAGIEISAEHRKTSGERTPASVMAGHGRNGAEAYRGARRGRGAACVLAPRGSVPGVSARQGVPAARSWTVGADERPSADRSDGVCVGKASLAAICAGRRSRRWLRKAWGRRSTTRRRRA
jgi:hypothetical protein